MAQRLKRWESPRREGRNDKGKGGSARQRQRRKQFQALRKKLKEQSDQHKQERGSNDVSPFFWAAECRRLAYVPTIAALTSSLTRLSNSTAQRNGQTSQHPCPKPSRQS
ncbi:MAG: hypothetical protein RBJ76_07510 [Stenomitos frigidus ULC029]